VHDPCRVCLTHSLAGLEHVLDRLVEGQPPFPLEERCQILPLEELHDDVGGFVLEGADVDHMGDMLALQVRNRARLSQEASARLPAGGPAGEHQLERDELPELEVRRGDDDAHGPCAEDALYTVLASEDVAGANGGGGGGSHGVSSHDSTKRTSSL